ncbi:MAG: c-type cytochrome [Deltaproteobacteria bacterium]|nr:c-type cytochrome [Deltaproteobacteria bacterium]
MSLACLPARAGGLDRGPDDSQARYHELGRTIYDTHCYHCHAYAGNANTLASTFLTPKPRDFTATSLDSLSREAMIDAVTIGRPGTGMKSFAYWLTPQEIAAVVVFVRREFMSGRPSSGRYHTPENGWPDHQRYAIAFPFATGAVPLDTPWEDLATDQRAGKRLYLSSCVSCHDRAVVEDELPIWEREVLSYPRFGFRPGDILLPPDAISGASLLARHDVAPVVEGLDETQREGRRLFLANCAFCHGADGTGKNWIGTFLEPHPRDLTDEAVTSRMTTERLVQVIREGLPGTSMPAWRSVLSDGQIAAVASYVRAAYLLASGVRQVVPASPAPATPTKGVP